jgi:hypothetical protein
MFDNTGNLLSCAIRNKSAPRRLQIGSAVERPSIEFCQIRRARRMPGNGDLVHRVTAVMIKVWDLPSYRGAELPEPRLATRDTRSIFRHGISRSTGSSFP